MEIYILRHGDAEPQSAEGEDSERRLTPKGRRDVEHVMRAAYAAKARPELVLTSPYRRALETAQIAVRELDDPKPPLVQTASLVPEGRLETLWKELRSHSAAEEVLLAGHEPQLSQLVAYLLAVPALRFDMKKGALVRIFMDRLGTHPSGELKWVLTPSLVRSA